jgi:hypothetical protein
MRLQTKFLPGVRSSKCDLPQRFICVLSRQVKRHGMECQLSLFPLSRRQVYRSFTKKSYYSCLKRFRFMQNFSFFITKTEWGPHRLKPVEFHPVARSELLLYNEKNCCCSQFSRYKLFSARKFLVRLRF